MLGNTNGSIHWPLLDPVEDCSLKLNWLGLLEQFQDLNIALTVAKTPATCHHYQLHLLDKYFSSPCFCNIIYAFNDKTLGNAEQQGKDYESFQAALNINCPLSSFLYFLLPILETKTGLPFLFLGVKNKSSLLHLVQPVLEGDTFLIP